MRRLPHILLAVAVAVHPWSGGWAVAANGAASATQVKAAFVCNFTQFVDWPAEAGANESGQFVLGVLCDANGPGGRAAGNNDDAFCDALTDLVVGKTAAGGHPIAVQRVTTVNDASNCQAVYVPASQDAQAKPLFAAIGCKAVLTVGDTDAFADAGGVIRFVPVGNRMRFEVHTPAVDKARLRVSSKLMKVAIVVDH